MTWMDYLGKMDYLAWRLHLIPSPNHARSRMAQAQTPVIIDDNVFDNDDHGDDGDGDSTMARIMVNAKLWQFSEK